MQKIKNKLQSPWGEPFTRLRSTGVFHSFSLIGGHFLSQLSATDSTRKFFVRRCCICMLDFEQDEPIRYLPCMHYYHVDCIDDWLMRSFTCPTCMEPVDAALLSTYDNQNMNAVWLPTRFYIFLCFIVDTPFSACSPFESFTQPGSCEWFREVVVVCSVCLLCLFFFSFGLCCWSVTCALAHWSKQPASPVSSHVWYDASNTHTCMTERLICRTGTNASGAHVWCDFAIQVWICIKSLIVCSALSVSQHESVAWYLCRDVFACDAGC